MTQTFRILSLGGGHASASALRKSPALRGIGGVHFHIGLLGRAPTRHLPRMAAVSLLFLASAAASDEPIPVADDGPRDYHAKYAVIVGVNDYSCGQGLRDLQYAANDAREFRKLLVEDFGYDDARILYLTDAKDEPQGVVDGAPTVTAICDAFEKWLPTRGLGADDSALYFFAGHGLHDDASSKGYLAEADSRKADKAGTCVAVEWLRDQLASQNKKRVPCRHRLVLLDCCYSGTLFSQPLVARPRPPGEGRPKAAGTSEGSVSKVTFSPEGMTLAAGYGYGYSTQKLGGGIVVWNLAERKLIRSTLDVREGVVTDIAFDAGGTTLASAYSGTSVSGGVVLWDAVRGRRLHTPILSLPESSVDGLSFSPDGETLAVGIGTSHGGGVVLWDIKTRRRLTDIPLSIPRGGRTVVTISPDFAMLAGASGGDGRIVLWDFHSRERLADVSLPVPDGQSNSIVFSSDGRFIAANYSGMKLPSGVVIWDSFSVASWLIVAGQVANRNLSVEEWREYMFRPVYKPTYPSLPVPSSVQSGR